MLNGLDLFSGIGGISIALREWVRPIAYCEIDPYCQGVLLSRMDAFDIANAPIWDDIRTLEGKDLPQPIDFLYGGFPCQDISVAGLGKGLAGERSGLFFEIVRLAKEIKPKFIFLENVPAITSRGGIRVVREIAEMGYDCRWCVISAASIGALHLRERWFLLGYSKHFGSSGSQERGSTQTSVTPRMLAKEPFSNSESQQNRGVLEPESQPHPFDVRDGGFEASWWATEPDVGRVANGVPQRVDRLKALGNAVVPEQAKEAFKILMGIK